MGSPTRHMTLQVTQPDLLQPRTHFATPGSAPRPITESDWSDDDSDYSAGSGQQASSTPILSLAAVSNTSNESLEQFRSWRRARQQQHDRANARRFAVCGVTDEVAAGHQMLYTDGEADESRSLNDGDCHEQQQPWERELNLRDSHAHSSDLAAYNATMLGEAHRFTLEAANVSSGHETFVDEWISESSSDTFLIFQFDP